MEVAARLLSIERKGVWHGIVPAEAAADARTRVYARTIQQGSPAESAEIRAGDRILQVNNLEIQRKLDLERAMLGQEAGRRQRFICCVKANRSQVRIRLAAIGRQRSAPPSSNAVLDVAWDKLGLRLAEQPIDGMRSAPSPFQGGLRMMRVRDTSPAAQQGVRPGDILVGLHKWKTASTNDLAYILKEPTVAQRNAIKFYVLRGSETLYGQFPVTWRR